MVVKHDIIYPVFLECCKFAKDKFWENVFEDLAYGKTPYGAYISKEYLCCSYKDREFSYKIKRKDPLVLYNDVYALLSDKLSMSSGQEKHKKRLDFYESENRIKELRKEWSNIRKKSVKDLLIECYVSDMKNKYKLSVSQARYLFSFIFIGLIFKVITSDDIKYSDGKIQNIDGIKLGDGEVNVERNLVDAELNLCAETPEDKKSMSDGWKKYIKTLSKNGSKYSRS